VRPSPPPDRSGTPEDSPLQGLLNRFPRHGFKACAEPKGDLDEVTLSPEQARQLEQTGCIVVRPVQTVGPTAKERQQRRLLAAAVVHSHGSARRLDRRLGCGRPPARRTSRATRAGPDDESDLPPEHLAASLPLLPEKGAAT
jgi:hypothetical protein